MTRSLEERSRLVDVTANRLRLIQEDLADESPGVREQHLAEIVEQALSRLVPEEHDAFLADLGARFPAWQTSVEMSPHAPSDVEKESDAERDLNDLGFLVSRIVELARPLPENERRVLIRRLHDAGLSSAELKSWSPDQLEEFWSRLKGERRGELDASRLLEMAGLLADFVTKLEQVAWQTWKKIGRSSSVRRIGNLPETMMRFACGDPDVPRGQVSNELEQLRMLTAALATAIAKTGAQYGQEHAARFSPGEIEAAAELNRNRWTSLETACWRKYKEIAARTDASVIENEIQQIIATLAESVMRARPTPSPTSRSNPNRVNR